MANLYQMRCECGEPFRVAPTQAGSDHACPRCGKHTEIPPLLELRQLPPAEADRSPSAKGTAWSAGRGVTFVLGLILIAVCSVAFWMLKTEREMLDVSRPDLADFFRHSDTENLTPSQVWQAWVDEFRDEQLESRETPYFLAQRRLHYQLTIWMVATGAGPAWASYWPRPPPWPDVGSDPSVGRPGRHSPRPPQSASAR